MNFDIFNAVILILAVIVAGNFLRDGKSNYLEGALCILIYIIIAVSHALAFEAFFANAVFTRLHRSRTRTQYTVPQEPVKLLWLRARVLKEAIRYGF